ncbi:hypothetical protein [Nocardioides sp. CFH 31398]|uniref:hypothetical protein n=1 Tax=Nocardioides sp. CFH 31398 TaxID=2919579 RepID=UPI001F06A955|nr:hypothetical protein [Nocardioides sp. CFH 31398]MCH1868724.1 hypothetical protein [Nocardioides sp. CFH 31398]
MAGNSISRSMHDAGLAAWFGGGLMGAVGLNGAAAAAKDPNERLDLSSRGWGRWAPVNAAAIGAHLIGGLGLVQANKARVVSQPGARSNTALKTVLTGAALGLTAWSGYLGRKVAEGSARGEQGQGATEPGSSTSEEVAAAQRQLKLAQWGIPAVTGALVVLASVQGEQQRPEQLVRSHLSRVPGVSRLA